MAMAMDNNVARIFHTFMSRVVALEDLAKIGSQMLALYQQELGPSVDNALKGLHNHIQQAHAIMEEIHSLLGEANGNMHEDLSTRLENVTLTEGEASSEIAQRAGSPEQISSPKTKVRQLFSPDYVTTMVAIYGMLQQDFIMQERVVNSLGLDVSPEVLQNYHMMWTLRPFVDDSVVEEALSWTRPYRG